MNRLVNGFTIFVRKDGICLRIYSEAQGIRVLANMKIKQRPDICDCILCLKRKRKML